jgi:hypothetical protein
MQAYTFGGVSGNHLDRIDAFVLLDLLGAKNPTIYSTNKSTEVSRHFNISKKLQLKLTCQLRTIK